MGLFKDVFCTECGEKTKMLTRTHLRDDSYLCSKCAAIVPSYMKKTFEGKYTIEEYREFKEYAKSSEEEYGEIFHETHSFHGIHIDTENRLFYMEDYSALSRVYLNFYNVQQFDLTFRAEEYKDGLFGNKVKGTIFVELEMDMPYFYYEGVLASDVKAKAKKSAFGNKVTYDNPEGMDDFLHYFGRAWEKDVEDYNRYIEEHGDEPDEADEE